MAGTGLGKPWTKQELSILEERRAQGVSVQQIADELGVKAQRVSDKLKKIGGCETRAHQTKARRCLTCGGHFAPEHRTNFVCAPCKSTSRWRMGIA